MKQYSKVIIIYVSVICFGLFFSFSPVSAQIGYYPGTFGTTSLSHLFIYPSLTSYYYPNYPLSSQYYYGGLSPLYGNVGTLPGYGGTSDYVNIMQAIQYYQYLSYAYNFYMIARQTPMFYTRDIVADYIGSALYSYTQNYELSPQDAIISFIQTNLL